MCSIADRAPMTQKQRLAEIRPAEIFTNRRGRREDRLPIETTVAVITCLATALWVLLALALDRLLF